MIIIAKMINKNLKHIVIIVSLQFDKDVDPAAVIKSILQ